MRLGLFMMPLHSLRLSYKEMYDQDYAAVLHADAVGFDEVWMGEHFSAKVEPVSNPLQFLSACIPVTKKVTFVTGVLNLPHRHPAQVAADAALFDHMSDGRFQMGIGPGGLASDFELFGTMDMNRGAMMMECADMIRKIWASDPPYEIDGEFWNIKVKETVQMDLGIGPMPKPFQDPFPPFITSAMSPFSGTAKMAGSKGWHLASANFNPAPITKSQWAAYTKGAESAGLTADWRTWRVARSILVTDSDAEAADYLARPDNTITDYYNYLRTQLSRAGLIGIFKSDQEIPDEEITNERCLEEMVIAGSVDTVVAKLEAFIDSVGPFGTLLSAFHEWDDEPLWRRSLDLLANKVMPRISASMEQRAKAAE
ncbi:MAG: LLM class flavin-dependent oxidoreductase [Kiloniellales bacterium]